MLWTPRITLNRSYQSNPLFWGVLVVTPWKTNMDPENHWLVEENSRLNTSPILKGPCEFSGVSYFDRVSYVKDFNCHIGTSICFWLFGFPGL